MTHSHELRDSAASGAQDSAESLTESATRQLRGLLFALQHLGVNRRVIELAARAGWLARGALYLALGSLATLAAAGQGGGLHDGKGVMRWVLSLPAGSVLVGVAATGFAGYALYCGALLLCGDGATGGHMSKIATRAKGGIGLVVYGSLAFTGTQLLFGHAIGADHKQLWIAALLHHTPGRIALGAAGLGTAAFGLYQLKYALDAKHADEVNRLEMSEAERAVFLWIGRVGISARGVVLGMVGYFVLRAAVDLAPRTASTVGALREARHVGWAPLAAIAIGLATYGVLQLFYARYRRVEIG